MDDALLVSRAMAGDLDSFGQLYDRYFNRIYDFVWRVVRDADDAADVTQDVFIKAMQGLGGLSKTSSFKSWLFTIAHNAAVTRAERAGRTVPLPAPVHEEAFGTFDVPDPCRLDDPEIAAGDHELAALVWEAATALNPRDYALLDLHVRQGMDSAEIAGVMNVSKGNAYTMVSRMKTAAGDVIGSYIVARRGSKDCELLQTVLAEHEFPPYTEQVRKAVDAHIKECETCQQSRENLVAPLEIFGAFAMVPAPMALKGDLWGNIAGGWNIGGPGATAEDGASAASMRRPASSPIAPLPPNPYGSIAAAGAGAAIGAGGVAAADAGGFGGGGGDDDVHTASLPMSDDGWDRNKIMLFAGAAIGLLIFAFAGGALISGAFGGGGGGGGSGVATATRTATAARSGTAVTTTTPGVSVQTPTPNLTPSKTPQPAPTETEAPTETPIPPPPPTSTPPPAVTPTRVVRPTATVPPSPAPSPTRTAIAPKGTATPCSPNGCPPIQ